ncbi:hypothetical protein CFOL_v3_20378 [Cephalotus follicularis]|uniref:Putative plant transposon protein domain-containing protein n=1 Tax=Cephalotus follicularis TaxID=3775 RepID=A0A1Q3C9J5_CEPFO|nr:hypothetical protein CFOL_v3_20378 [Cephalotus follicularis]
MPNTKNIEAGEGSRKKRKSVGHKGKGGTSLPATPEATPSLPRYTEAYFNRKILVGKVLDFDFCNNEGFPIVERLNTQGLELLFSINLPSYPELIKEFYVHILATSRVDLTTKVKNTEIAFDVPTLANILGIPREGPRGWNQRNWLVNENFDKVECVKLLFGENADFMKRMYTRNLSLHHRFLHRVVATHILPKAGGFDEVTHMEAYTMYHLITGKRINVPYLIINHMHAIHDRENARLAYSNIITKILLHFEIDITGEVHHPLQNVDKLGKGTLERMGFKKHKRLGTWIPREEDSNRVIDEEGEAEIGDEAQGEPREPQEEPTTNINLPSTKPEEILEAIKGLQQDVQEMKMNVQSIKRRQMRMAKRFAKTGIIGNEGLISSSSSHDDDNIQRDDAVTDDLEGDMVGDNEDTPMDD